ncbi:MAG: hypothetical protein ACLRZH_00880 [Ruthenibacterium lactatiformans]
MVLAPVVFLETMLDLGEAFAWDIARTALEAWKREWTTATTPLK